MKYVKSHRRPRVGFRTQELTCSSKAKAYSHPQGKGIFQKARRKWLLAIWAYRSQALCSILKGHIGVPVVKSHLSPNNPPTALFAVQPGGSSLGRWGGGAVGLEPGPAGGRSAHSASFLPVMDGWPLLPLCGRGATIRRDKDASFLQSPPCSRCVYTRVRGQNGRRGVCSGLGPGDGRLKGCSWD